MARRCGAGARAGSEIRTHGRAEGGKNPRRASQPGAAARDCEGRSGGTMAPPLTDGYGPQFTGLVNDSVTTTPADVTVALEPSPTPKAANAVHTSHLRFWGTVAINPSRMFS